MASNQQKVTAANLPPPPQQGGGGASASQPHPAEAQHHATGHAPGTTEPVPPAPGVKMEVRVGKPSPSHFPMNHNAAPFVPHQFEGAASQALPAHPDPSPQRASAPITTDNDESSNPSAFDARVQCLTLQGPEQRDAERKRTPSPIMQSQGLTPNGESPNLSASLPPLATPPLQASTGTSPTTTAVLPPPGPFNNDNFATPPLEQGRDGGIILPQVAHPSHLPRRDTITYFPDGLQRCRNSPPPHHHQHPEDLHQNQGQQQSPHQPEDDWVHRNLRYEEDWESQQPQTYEERCLLHNGPPPPPPPPPPTGAVLAARQRQQQLEAARRNRGDGPMPADSNNRLRFYGGNFVDRTAFEQGRRPPIKVVSLHHRDRCAEQSQEQKGPMFPATAISDPRPWSEVQVGAAANREKQSLQDADTLQCRVCASPAHTYSQCPEFRSYRLKLVEKEETQLGHITFVSMVDQQIHIATNEFDPAVHSSATHTAPVGWPRIAVADVMLAYCRKRALIPENTFFFDMYSGAQIHPHEPTEFGKPIQGAPPASAVRTILFPAGLSCIIGVYPDKPGDFYCQHGRQGRASSPLLQWESNTELSCLHDPLAPQLYLPRKPEKLYQLEVRVRAQFRRYLQIMAGKKGLSFSQSFFEEDAPIHLPTTLIWRADEAHVSGIYDRRLDRKRQRQRQAARPTWPTADSAPPTAGGDSATPSQPPPRPLRQMTRPPAAIPPPAANPSVVKGASRNDYVEVDDERLPVEPVVEDASALRRLALRAEEEREEQQPQAKAPPASGAVLPPPPKYLPPPPPLPGPRPNPPSYATPPAATIPKSVSESPGPGTLPPPSPPIVSSTRKAPPVGANVVQVKPKRKKHTAKHTQSSAQNSPIVTNTQAAVSPNRPSGVVAETRSEAADGSEEDNEQEDAPEADVESAEELQLPAALESCEPDELRPEEALAAKSPPPPPPRSSPTTAFPDSGAELHNSAEVEVITTPPPSSEAASDGEAASDRDPQAPGEPTTATIPQPTPSKPKRSVKLDPNRKTKKKPETSGATKPKSKPAAKKKPHGNKMGQGSSGDADDDALLEEALQKAKQAGSERVVAKKKDRKKNEGGTVLEWETDKVIHSSLTRIFAQVVPWYSDLDINVPSTWRTQLPRLTEMAELVLNTCGAKDSPAPNENAPKKSPTDIRERLRQKANEKKGVTKEPHNYVAGRALALSLLPLYIRWTIKCEHEIIKTEGGAEEDKWVEVFPETRQLLHRIHEVLALDTAFLEALDIDVTESIQNAEQMGPEQYPHFDPDGPREYICLALWILFSMVASSPAAMDVVLLVLTAADMHTIITDRNGPLTQDDLHSPLPQRAVHAGGQQRCVLGCHRFLEAGGKLHGWNSRTTPQSRAAILMLWQSMLVASIHAFHTLSAAEKATCESGGNNGSSFVLPSGVERTTRNEVVSPNHWIQRLWDSLMWLAPSNELSSDSQQQQSPPRLTHLLGAAQKGRLGGGGCSVRNSDDDGDMRVDDEVGLLIATMSIALNQKTQWLRGGSPNLKPPIPLLTLRGPFLSYAAHAFCKQLGGEPAHAGVLVIQCLVGWVDGWRNSPTPPEAISEVWPLYGVLCEVLNAGVRQIAALVDVNHRLSQLEHQAKAAVVLEEADASDRPNGLFQQDQIAQLQAAWKRQAPFMRRFSLEECMEDEGSDGTLEAKPEDEEGVDEYLDYYCEDGDGGGDEAHPAAGDSSSDGADDEILEVTDGYDDFTQRMIQAAVAPRDLHDMLREDCLDLATVRYPYADHSFVGQPREQVATTRTTGTGGLSFSVGPLGRRAVTAPIRFDIAGDGRNVAGREEEKEREDSCTSDVPTPRSSCHSPHPDLFYEDEDLRAILTAEHDDSEFKWSPPAASYVPPPQVDRYHQDHHPDVMSFPGSGLYVGNVPRVPPSADPSKRTSAGKKKRH